MLLGRDRDPASLDELFAEQAVERVALDSYLRVSRSRE